MRTRDTNVSAVHDVAERLIGTHDDLDPERIDPDLMRRVSRHVERHLRTIEGVFCEELEGSLHMDVLWLAPVSWDPRHHLITCGASAHRMDVPPERPDSPYMELVLTLPPEWPIWPEALRHEEGWPIRQLLNLARLPQETGCYFGRGGIVGTQPPSPFSGRGRICGWVLGRPVQLAAGFETLSEGPGTTVFHNLVPLLPGDLGYEPDADEQAMLERFSRQGVPAVPDLAAAMSGGTSRARSLDHRPGRGDA